jgi:glycosyltransferase involved in cell wall biosynthesis
MRLAFFCGSLEPGRDGVGDYTRRLAGEILRREHACVCVALHDSHIDKILTQPQEIEGIAVPTVRLPAGHSWEGRMNFLRGRMGEFHPDWISLQFVPFAFQNRGICAGLGKRLASLHVKAHWHFMFHELWLGLDEHASLKHRVWGALQRFAVLDMEGRLRPRLISTQSEPYRTALARENIVAQILPLFSNIPPTQEDGWEKLLKPLLQKSVAVIPPRGELYVAGVLGAVHTEWKIEKVLNTLLPLVKRFRKRLVLVFIGKNNMRLSAFDELKTALRNRADVIVTGERSGVEISEILNALDLGLATSPQQNIQKSGSVAAMLEHGLPVLVTRDDWHLRAATFSLADISRRLFAPEQFPDMESLPRRDPHPPKECGLKNVADLMLTTMKQPLTALGPKK